MDLKNAAELAYNVLRNNTPYAKQKKIISTCFLNKFKALNYKETIIARLALIDGFYSTNVNAKRYFGIEEIAEQLLKVASDDSKAKSIFISFIDNIANEQNGEIDGLFCKKYGITKSGKPNGIAPSLISKYAYFLCKYKFPIYDSLVLKSYNSLCGQNDNVMRIRGKKFINAIEHIAELNVRTEINDFNKTDNLLWLYGKVRACNFSLVLGKENYLKLIKIIGSGNSQSQIKIIRKILMNKKSKQLNFIGIELKQFMRFVYEID